MVFGQGDDSNFYRKSAEIRVKHQNKMVILLNEMVSYFKMCLIKKNNKNRKFTFLEIIIKLELNQCILLKYKNIERLSNC